MVDTLLFVLSDSKTYPTCDGLGTQCGMGRSKAPANLHTLSPLLHDTLVRLERLPHRECKTPEALHAVLQGAEPGIIEATERASRRSQEDAKQREHSSGKKPHTLKHTVLSLPDKCIVFLGRTLRGHHHDDTRLKHELPPEIDWCTALHGRVDLGSLGMPSDDSGDQMDLPTKKPCKSHKNPSPQLSDEQRAAHTALSRVRIFIAQAIGGMKRYNILVHTFRNRAPFTKGPK